MKNGLIAKIVFLALVIGLVWAGSALYLKNAPKPAAAPIAAAEGTRGEPAAAQQCVITIDGKKYDVEPLRSKHPGGDIFECGTDMSATFHGQHGASVKRIEPYLLK